jgi:hypothetical protein
VAIRVDAAAGIAEAGSVAHPGVHRSIVVGDALYTVSDRGMSADDLGTFADRGYLEFTR